MPPSQLNTRATFIIYGAVAVYAAAFQAQLPVQPFLIQSMSNDAVTVFTGFRTFIAILQLFGSLLSGWLIDKMGARKVLLLSLGASALSYVITAKATTLTLVFIAQAPTLFQHAVLAARSYLTVLVPPGPQRAIVLGRITFAYAIGMVIGPSAGGFLAAFDVTYSALFAAAGSLASLVLVYLYLPEATLIDIGPMEADGVTKRANEDGVTNTTTSSGGGGYTALLAIPGVLPALCVKTIFYSSLAIFTSAFQLLALDRFKLDAATVGTILSVFGAFSIVGSVFVVPYVRPRMAPTQACIIAASIFSLTLFFFSAVTTTEHIFILTVPQAISSVLFTTINSGEMSGLVPQNLQGSLHAADMASSSCLRIVSPVLSAFLIFYAGFYSIGITTGILMFLVAALFSFGIGTTDVRGG
jgi:predicted MFS family arabinose efflux permease